MKGGALTQHQIGLLRHEGISDYQIQALQDFNVDYNYVMGKINEVETSLGPEWQGNSDEIIEEVMNRIYNDQLPNDQLGNDQMNIADNIDFGNINQQDNNDIGPMDIGELEIPINDDGETDNEEYSQNSQVNGGRPNFKKSNTFRLKLNKRKTRKIKKTRKTKKLRGGRGITTTETMNPISYKEDEYDQLKNTLNYK